MDTIQKFDAALNVQELQLPTIPDGLTSKERLFFESYFKKPDYFLALKAAGYRVDDYGDENKVLYNLRRSDEFRTTLAAFHQLLGRYVKATLARPVDIHTELYDELPLDALSEGQRRFVMNYTGDVKAALKAAGLTPTKQNAHRVMSLPHVRMCIDRVREYMSSSLLMKSEDILARVESIVDSETASDAIRLKALDMLAGFHGMKSEKLIIEAKTEMKHVEPFKTPKFIGTSAVIDTSED